MSDHTETEAVMVAWAELTAAAELFDRQCGVSGRLVSAIEALIDAKVANALEQYAFRIEDATGVRP
jgi:hypothetical protein